MSNKKSPNSNEIVVTNTKVYQCSHTDDGGIGLPEKHNLKLIMTAEANDSGL